MTPLDIGFQILSDAKRFTKFGIAELNLCPKYYLIEFKSK
jgi:hypothetical protein